MDYNDNRRRIKQAQYVTQVEAKEFIRLQNAVEWLNDMLNNKEYATMALKKNNDNTYLASVTYRIYI